jgi:sugar/nucleoside kinase (ribokinase family)
MYKPQSFLSIGDTVCDVFIELIDAHITCDIDTTNCELCMKFGDKLPFRSATTLYGVGNSANAAVSLGKLGSPSTLLTHIGMDDNGNRSLSTLADASVETSLVIRQSGTPTNFHYVLWYPPERTILVKHEEYDYNFSREISPLSHPVDWVYLSSLGSGTEQYHTDILGWLGENPLTRLVFQPGTFQMKLPLNIAESLYARSELVFCNREESIRILDQLRAPFTGDPSETRELLVQFHHHTRARVVIITDGPAGSYSYDGTTALFCPAYPDPKPPLERTGAGDAYASCFSFYYASGMSISDCMLRAPINSMSVVQQIGAQAGLLANSEIEQYLAQKPESYSVEYL